MDIHRFVWHLVDMSAINVNMDWQDRRVGSGLRLILERCLGVDQSYKWVKTLGAYSSKDKATGDIMQISAKRTLLNLQLTRKPRALCLTECRPLSARCTEPHHSSVLLKHTDLASTATATDGSSISQLHSIDREAPDSSIRQKTDEGHSTNEVSLRWQPITYTADHELKTSLKIKASINLCNTYHA